jgi:FixJ family two-component response regulator
MCRLSKREKQVLELALTSHDDKIVAANLGMKPEQVSVYKSRARRKVAKARGFLEMMKKYKPVLFAEKEYKGIR